MLSISHSLRLIACLSLCFSANSFSSQYVKIFNKWQSNWYIGTVNPILDLNGNIHPYSGNSIQKNRNLSGIDLSQANLNSAYINGANLSHSTLIQTDFSFSDAIGVDFSYSNLSSANFRTADLRDGTNFMFSDLSDADFTGAYMTGVDLRNSNVSGANFSNIVLCCYNFDQLYVSGAIFSESTIFPSGFDPVAEGMIFVSEVPLPAGIYLFLSGLVGLGLMRGKNA